MWKYSFVASNCPGHHPAGAGAGVAVTFSWQLAAAGLQLVSPHSPLPRHGDWTGSCRLVTTAAHWEKGWKEVPQYWSPGPFDQTTLFLGVDATQFSIPHLNLCHLNMLRLFFKSNQTKPFEPDWLFRGNGRIAVQIELFKCCCHHLETSCQFL